MMLNRIGATAHIWLLLSLFSACSWATPDPLNYGIELRQQGQLQQSVEVLSQAVKQDPQHLRLKLELAVSHLQLGNLDQAQRLAAAVLQAEQVPTQVRENIEHFLASIERQRRGHAHTPWLHRLTLFAGHDNNATIGPNSTDLDIGQLKRDSVKNEDVFAGGQYDLTYLSNRTSTQQRYYAGVSFYDKRYQDISRSNLSFANARMGLYQPLSQHLMASAGLALNHIYLGNDPLANYSYANLAASWQANRQHRLKLALEANPRRYISDHDDDRQGVRWGQRVSYRFDWAQHQIELFSHWRQANLDGKTERYREQQWQLQWQRPWQLSQQQWQLSWHSAYSQRHYQHVDDRYANQRDDHSWRHRLAMEWQWHPRWQLALSHQLDKRHSNQDIYQYQRQLTQLNLQYRTL